MKFYYITNVTDPNTSGNETTFWNFHGNAICFFFLNETNITASLLMIRLKCTVANYAIEIHAP